MTTTRKQVAFKGLNSDDEHDRTLRGQRSRKERKALKHKRKMAYEFKKKRKARKKQERLIATFNKLNLSTKKKVALKDCALCGVPAVVRSSDDYTTSEDDDDVDDDDDGDDSLNDYRDVRNILREQVPVAGSPAVAFSHMKQSPMFAFGSSSRSSTSNGTSRTNQLTTGAEKVVGVIAAVGLDAVVPWQQADRCETSNS